MKKIIASLGILVLALSVIGIAAGGGGGGRDLVKLSLINAAGPAGQTYGTVVFNGGKEKVSVDVEVRGLKANYRYVVFLEIGYSLPGWVCSSAGTGGTGCPIIGEINTDASGNGRLETSKVMPAGQYQLGIDVADEHFWEAQFITDGNKDGVWSGAVDLLNTVTVEAGTGFDQWGYNRNAGIFVGTGSSWCLARGSAADCMGIYSPDKLVMKWTSEWDRGNAENWLNPPYWGAWENNEWNGAAEGGSGAVWHYKIQWVGACGADYTPLADGGYCIWGQFETIMDQGMDPSIGPGHMWFAHASPTGYGA